MKSCCKQTLAHLAEALQKSLPPDVFEKFRQEVRWANDPLGQLLEVLRDDSNANWKTITLERNPEVIAKRVADMQRISNTDWDLLNPDGTRPRRPRRPRHE